MKLAGKVAIITGAARGIGRATAIELAKNGADVIVNDLNHRDEAEEVIRQIESHGRRALFFQSDVADREANRRMVEETVRAFGHLDILVNNAAFGTRKPFLELETEEMERTLAVSLWGVFHCSQLAARQMVKQDTGGNIVIISSVHAYRPYPLATAYNAAKAAVNQMAFTWAVELAKHKIRVNVIEPGWIDTPGERSVYSEQHIIEEGKKLLRGRLGRPGEIAKGVLFLVSDEDSSYITGSCLRIDGGFVLPYK